MHNAAKFGNAKRYCIILAKIFVADIYNDQTYLDNNPTWHEEDSFFKASKIIALLKKNNIEFETVCDVGCGAGEILIQLHKEFPSLKKLTGLEISNDIFSIAKAKETGTIYFELKDIKDVDENFDLTLVIDVIEHLENYFSFLETIHSKSYYTIFHIPLDMSIWSLFREQMLIESKNRVGHIHNFTENFIINIIESKGFTVIDKLYTEPGFKHITSKQKIINGLRKFIFKINQRFCTKTLGGYSIMLLTKNTKAGI